jgi:hypothetical protein
MRFPAALSRIGINLAVAGLLVSTSSAQTSNATLTGVVRDGTGAVIPGATVTATNTQNGLVKSSVSDGEGRYTILSLLPGSYDVQAANTGFATSVRRNQELLVGTTPELDFELKPSTSDVTVEVTAVNAAALETTQNTVDRVLAPAELDNLPIADRNFAELAALTPGVQITTTATVGTSPAISVGNGPSDQTGFIVDGVTNQAGFDGGQFINFSQDWVKEFSVMTNSFPAEYGAAAAGVVNAVTRSGTNRIHGRGYGFFQNNSLNATPSFLPPSAPEKPPSSSQRLGGMAGGPIIKDKLFYFGGFERFHEHVSVPVNIPSAFVGPGSDPGVFPADSISRIAMLRLDYQPSERDSFMARSAVELDVITNSGVGASGSSILTVGNGEESWVPNYSEVGSWTHIISTSSINEMRFVLTKNGSGESCNYAQIVGPYLGTGPNATSIGNPTGFWAQVAYPQAPGGSITTGCPTNFGHLDENLGSLYETYTVTHGNHEVKVGGDLEFDDEYTSNFHNNSDGEYSINGTSPFNPSTLSTYPVSLFMTTQPAAMRSWQTPSWGNSFFAQDTWKITPKLTLNTGIRYDLSYANSELTPTFTTGANIPAPYNHPIGNDYFDIGPRFGFAWTPRKDQHTVIRGGLGIYWDENHNRIATSYITVVPKVTYSSNVNATRPSANPYCFATTSPCANDIVPTNYVNDVQEVLASALFNDTLPNFSPPGNIVTVGSSSYVIDPLPTVPGVSGGTTPAPTSGFFNVDPNIKVPGTLQISAGVQQQVTSQITVSADYVRVRNFNGIILFNANVNQVTLGSVDPRYTSVLTYGNGGFYVSDHLLVHASYRDRRSDSFQAAYTFGYAHDNSISGFSTSSRATPATDPFNFNQDYGPSPTDARNILNISGMINAPFRIQLAPLISYTSPFPYSATTTVTTPGCLTYFNACYPTGYTRDSLRGDQTFSLNGRLSKSITLPEKSSLMIFFEAYNATNKINTGTNFQTNVSSSSFGKPDALTSPRRQLQIGARFDF